MMAETKASSTLTHQIGEDVRYKVIRIVGRLHVCRHELSGMCLDTRDGRPFLFQYKKGKRVIGDRDGDGVIIEERYAVKSFGELSHGATWVKEGNVLKQSQLMLTICDTFCPFKNQEEMPLVGQWKVAVVGPCGHPH